MQIGARLPPLPKRQDFGPLIQVLRFDLLFGDAARWTSCESPHVFLICDRPHKVIANVMAKRASMATTRNASVAMGGALTAPLRPPGAKTA